MKLAVKKLILIFGALALVVFAANAAAAQNERPVRLRSGVAVGGFVGGEAHESFVIRARRGQTMTVLITRRVKRGDSFNLTVSRGANFFEASPVRFGRETSTRPPLVWTGRIPANGNYYFYTTAHPDARYTLKVTLR